MELEIHQDAESLEGFYSRLGIAVLDTIPDGDCAIDTMCIMLGLPRTQEQRNAIREELYEYIVERAQERRLHDVLVACCETSVEEADMFAESKALEVVNECGSGGLTVVEDRQPAVAGESSAAPAVSEKTREALRRATSVQDESIIEGLALGCLRLCEKNKLYCTNGIYKRPQSRSPL